MNDVWKILFAGMPMLFNATFCVLVAIHIPTSKIELFFLGAAFMGSIMFSLIDMRKMGDKVYKYCSSCKRSEGKGI